MIGDQLPAVLVAADDEASPAQLVGQPGDRGHDVVGLESLIGQQRNSQGLDHAMHEADLRHEVLVHVGPTGLVLLVKLVAECLARQIEGAEEEIGLFRFQQKEQVPRKPIDGIDRLPGGAGHVRDGVEDLVDQGMGIDHPDRLAGETFGLRRDCRIGLQPVSTAGLQPVAGFGLQSVAANRCGWRRRRFHGLLIEERFLILGGALDHRELANHGSRKAAVYIRDDAPYK